MDISTLDEYQGIEAQMVRDWMTRKGCYRQDGYWRHPRDKYSYTDGEYGGLLWEDTLFKLSVDFGFGSVQSLLCEINPRMRKGMPSEAARTASRHNGGMWIASRGELGKGGTIVFVCFDSDSEDGLPLAIWDGEEWDHWEVEPREIENEWSFWPCDEHGNKVRWPEKDGVML